MSSIDTGQFDSDRLDLRNRGLSCFEAAKVISLFSLASLIGLTTRP